MVRVLAMLALVCCVALSSAGSAGKDKGKSRFDRWEKSIAAIEKRDRTAVPAEGSIFFCGSSTIVRWHLAKSFPKLPVVNRGFGGSQIADSTHFASRIILPYRPAIVVLYAGDNDLAAGKTPEQVRDDFRAFVKRIHDKLPKTKILFLSIKPSIARWKLLDRISKANRLIGEECKKEAGLTFVDVGSVLLGKDGKPRKEMFEKDGLHLSPAGYKAWTEKLLPLLSKAVAPQNPQPTNTEATPHRLDPPCAKTAGPSPSLRPRWASAPSDRVCRQTTSTSAMAAPATPVRP
jgi:lysophospholipase L1-like esterase